MQKKNVWIFDNSFGHSCKAKDALFIGEINIGPGGKNVPNMCDTVIPEDNPYGLAGVNQGMQFDPVLPEEHPYKCFQGKPKGTHVILEEHGFIKINPKLSRPKGIDHQGNILVSECGAYKKFKSCKPKMTGQVLEDITESVSDRGDSEDEDHATGCCLR